MTLYWTLKSFPELRELESHRRKIVWELCWRQPFRHWQTWLAFMIQIVFLYVGHSIGALLDGSNQPTDSDVSFPIITPILRLAGGLIGILLFIQVYARMLRSYLRQHVQMEDAC